MAFDFCKVTVVGRLVADPRLGNANGKTVLNCRVAATTGYGNNESSVFLDFSIWDKLADVMKDKLSKGSKVLVHGDLGSREYETQGQKRTAYEIRFTDQFLLMDGGGGRFSNDGEDTSFEPDRFDGRGGGRSGGGFPGRR